MVVNFKIFLHLYVTSFPRSSITVCTPISFVLCMCGILGKISEVCRSNLLSLYIFHSFFFAYPELFYNPFCFYPGEAKQSETKQNKKPWRNKKIKKETKITKLEQKFKKFDIKYTELDTFLLVSKGSDIFECLLPARELCWTFSPTASFNPDNITFDRWCFEIESVGFALSY